MASYERQCVICNKPFTATAARAKYCSVKCRAIGADKARKEWEANSNYKEKQRQKMRDRRSEEIAELKRIREEEWETREAKENKEYEARKKRERAEMKRKAKAGDREAKMYIAEEEGDLLEYWRLFKEDFLENENKSKYKVLYIVGGIDIYEDDFEYLVVEQIEKSGNYPSIIRKTEQKKNV
ncbi:MAG: hypothetical protein GX222_02130 [Ruminococcaceae bacterium]|nr:hypothetical protein [Oscillospiraceae bacterium]